MQKKCIPLQTNFYDHCCPVLIVLMVTVMLCSRLENMNSSSESINGEQIKTVVEERVDENGKKIRVTRKIRLRLVHEQVCPAVAERRVYQKICIVHILIFFSRGPSLELLLATSLDPISLRLFPERLSS